MKLIAGLVALVAVGGGLALTNPSPEAYAEEASHKLVEKLQTESCSKLSNTFGINLQEQCRKVVADLRPQLKGLIESGTERTNLGVVSHYKTTLTASSLLPDFLSGQLPSYEVESLGVATQFVFYRAEEVPAPEESN
ncbi:MAG: DUF4359 domain-containing protein [Cyanobacteria bacterium P01_D01_bin.73]